MRIRLTVAVLVVGVAAGGAWFVAGSGWLGKRPPNVVLISLDTCRADHLSCYGRFKQRTPNIDAVAAGGVLFANVISHVPLTLPSHSSMLTGTLPPYHGVHDNISYRLGDSSVTLAEVLKDHGYQTAAVIGAFILDARFGLSQGFDFYDDGIGDELTLMGGHPERRGEEVSRIAGAWLDEHAKRPFFMFLHYYDPHDPYRPPSLFARLFADDPYAGEIAYVDHAVGQVIDRLKQLGVYDNTLLIITGDHGESLGEHGELKHGYFVYHSTTKVPLIIKPPGPSRSRRVKRKVALVDVMPTVLSLLDLPTPEGLDGLDLSPHFTGSPATGDERYIYSEAMLATKYGCSSLLAVETEEWKYIQTTKPELYHLTVDPQETNNLLAKEPRRARLLQDHLRSILERPLRVAPTETNLAMTQVALQRLKDLGYMGGAVDQSLEFDTSKPDPKDFLEIFTGIELVEYAISNENLTEAERLCDELLLIDDNVAHVHGLRAQVAVMQRDDETAITHYLAALALNSERGDWHNNLGILLARAGRFDEADTHYQAALRLAQRGVAPADDPDAETTSQEHDDSVVFDIRFNLGRLRLGQGKPEEAVREFREAQRLKSGEAKVRYHLGRALSQLGRTTEAEAEFLETLRIDPDHDAAKRALRGEPFRSRP